MPVKTDLGSFPTCLGFGVARFGELADLRRVKLSAAAIFFF